MDAWEPTLFNLGYSYRKLRCGTAKSDAWIAGSPSDCCWIMLLQDV